ncbi:glycosyltransferase [Fusobacterium sp.]|uniref:glycosyltransferase n=1 Tax=Fusobacterium sp. TaxID=68766 RepID=UPI00396CE050
MRKKIIIRSGSLRMGGLERVLIEILQSIDKKKYDIILIIDDDCGYDNIFEKDIPQEINYYFLKSQNLIKKTEYFKKRKNNIFFKLIYNLFMNFETFIMCYKMKKILNMIGPVDLLIDFDGGASKYIHKLKVPKKIVWIHNSIPRLKKKKSKIIRFGKRIENYDRVVAICDEMKEELEEIYPNLKGKVVRIYNMFNFDRILQQKDDISELKTEQLTYLNDDYCIAISRLDTVQKDYATLIEAFSLLNKNGISKKLYIVGDGPDKRKIEQMIKDKNMDKNIKILGRFKNPYIWLSHADFFIHSSKYEGFGLVLVEAAILGKMIVSSDCPVGPKEILENGKNGILFKTGVAKELVDAVEKIEKDPSLKNKYIINMNNSLSKFKKNKILQDIEKLIDGEI